MSSFQELMKEQREKQNEAFLQYTATLSDLKHKMSEALTKYENTIETINKEYREKRLRRKD